MSKICCFFLMCIACFVRSAAGERLQGKIVISLILLFFFYKVSVTERHQLMEHNSFSQNKSTFRILHRLFCKLLLMFSKTERFVWYCRRSPVGGLFIIVSMWSSCWFVWPHSGQVSKQWLYICEFWCQQIVSHLISSFLLSLNLVYCFSLLFFCHFMSLVFLCQGPGLALLVQCPVSTLMQSNVPQAFVFLTVDYCHIRAIVWAHFCQWNFFLWFSVVLSSLIISK